MSYRIRHFRNEKKLGRVSSRSRLWDRYWGQNKIPEAILSPVTVPQGLQDVTRPRFLLVSKVANGFKTRRLYNSF